MTDFADIDARREALGVSQAELCRKANISETTYVRARKGRGDVRGRTVRALAEALKTFEPEAAE